MMSPNSLPQQQHLKTCDKRNNNKKVQDLKNKLTIKQQKQILSTLTEDPMSLLTKK